MMIPFSVEFEARLWELRENPSAKQVGVGTRSSGQGTCLAANSHKHDGGGRTAGRKLVGASFCLEMPSTVYSMVKLC